MKSKFYFTKTGKIRIISGKWKGRNIPVMCDVSLRPTTSRIRETLFNWIEPVISSAICLDCFAGSGSLGLESLSRGAKKVTFIDNNNICTNALNKIKHVFQEYNSDIIRSDCCRWLRQSRDTYDIIFIDPPFYNYRIILEVIFLLEKYHHFKKQSWIYIETVKQQDIFDIHNFAKNWYLYRLLTTRTILCCLYCRID